MHILIIGYSAITKKRVIPALLKMRGISRIDIASRSFAAGDPPALDRPGDYYADYAGGLKKSGAELVYISLINSAHAAWAAQALVQGRHVIIDKPSCTCLEDAVRLADIARKQQRCLVEATVYAFHPQIQKAKDLFGEAGTAPTRLTVFFSFPPLPKDNFRYRKELGGGALWDLGPYAVSPGRLFFNAEPQEVFCRVCSRNPETGVDTAFSMLALYPGGRTMTGHFDFNTEYRNCINILGPGMSVDIDRVFTTPPDVENRLVVRSKNSTSRIATPPTDSFASFLESVCNEIKENNYSHFAEELLSDAAVLDRLRRDAGETESI